MKNLKSRKRKLFVTRKLPGNELERLNEYFDVKVWDKSIPPSKKELMDNINDVDALITLLSDPIDADVLDHAPNLKFIAQYAVGTDNIDLEECNKRGILVSNTPDVLTESCADFTIGLMIGIMRRIVDADEFVRSGKWYEGQVGWAPTMLLGTDVHEKTLGIIGMGRIGEAVMRRALGFSMKILYYSRTRKEWLEKKHGIKFAELDELLSKSDVVSIHVPLTSRTKGLISKEKIELMKPTAFLINISRGAVIDENALIDALKNNKIAGAALDVFMQEPLPPNSELARLKNVLLAPHAASAGIETRINMAKLVVDNLVAWAKGDKPPTVINT